MSPWVRIDENAMDHPKFLAISANAWRLWCEGGTYCQKHLTDGFIPRAALKGFRYYSAVVLKQLTVSLVPGKDALWHETPEGITVHDYLTYNDSREEVLKAREQGKRRRRKYLERHASGNASLDADETANVSCGVVCSSEQRAAEKREGGVGETVRDRRAGAFIEWYEDTHERLFRIAYMGTNSDWVTVLRLVDKFTDAQLRDAAMVWFGMDDDFAMNGTRTVPKFASRITGCLQTIQQRGIA
jgi:hypothetical protein